MTFTRLLIKYGSEIADNMRDSKFKTPDDIERIDDISYGKYSENTLDIYGPKGMMDNTMPLIVSVHGGGWVYGDKERYQYYCMSLAQQGFKVVNFTYRLAPEYLHPAQLEDVCTCFKWVKENADKYHFDLNNVFAVGDSAGAHLLSLYSCLKGSEELQNLYPFGKSSVINLNAIALNCGVYDIRLGKKIQLVDSLRKDLLGHELTKEDSYAISPINFVNKSCPPTMLMTCSGDFLINEAKPMEEKLKENNVEAVYKFYGDDKNKLTHVFHVNIGLDEAKLCNKVECDFFKDYIK